MGARGLGGDVEAEPVVAASVARGAGRVVCYAEGLAVGQRVQAGDVIGFMGRTGYSAQENVNNIETVHLHFGLQLIFDESQKECDSEIWIDVYPIIELLASHCSSVARDPQTGRWERLYPYCDLDAEPIRSAAAR